MSKAEWKRRQRRRRYIAWSITLGAILLVMGLIIFGIVQLIRNIFFQEEMGTWNEAGGTAIQASFLTPSEYSRPQMKLEKVKDVVIHNVGSAGVTAVSSRNTMEQMRVLKNSTGSVHFIVGLDGEIIQCIPVNEVCYATGERNLDTISIEYCHEDTAGTPESKTYDSLVKLTAKVCKEYKLKAENILRHVDASGIECPVYFIENEAEWVKFKTDVMAAVKTIE